MEKRNREDLRELTFGILRSMDLGIVHADTLMEEAERQLLYNPDYWLAPCLTALAAWLSDERTVAEQAIEEAKSRNAMKTALFFALICIREDRLEEGQAWISYYQDLQKKDLESCEYGSVFPGMQAARSVARKKDLKEYMENPSASDSDYKKRMDSILQFLIQDLDEEEEESELRFEDLLLKAIIRPETVNAGKDVQLFALTLLKDVILAAYDTEESKWIGGISL